MNKRNIGLVLSLYRYGGGTYQWTTNILCALEDYRRANPNVSITILYSKQGEDCSLVQARFPGFHYCPVGRMDLLMCKALTRLFIMAPPILPVLRRFYPLTPLAQSNHVDWMIFPGASFHPCFYDKKQIFMFTDIAHVFYPHFPEVSVRGELRRRHLLFDYGIRQAQCVLVDSEQLRQDLARHYRADKNRVSVLYQTLSRTLDESAEAEEDLGDFLPLLSKRYLFYPAQLWAHKNHRNLLLAMKILLERDQDLLLVLSGSRKEGDEQIFAFIRELGLQNNVRYLGYVPDKAMPLLYKNARMLVMPTYFGPTNIPTLEAFHFGCPAVISKIPGVKEQTEDAALLFDPDSPEDIAAQIRRVLEDGVLRESMVRKGYERIKELSFSNYSRHFSAILDHVLNRDIVIVLTGTIIPTVPLAGHPDAGKRKEEYLAAIKFYKQFARVYFLENSAYPLLSDPDFMNMEGVYLRQFPPSSQPGRGKGYQEFEMIDKWLAMETLLPASFLKITGRYIIRNFGDIFHECESARTMSFLIDRFGRSGVAITRLFFVRTSYYLQHLAGIYQDCSDEDGRWVERVLYKRLSDRSLEANIFRHEPLLAGIEGGSGRAIKPDFLRHLLKKMHRRINFMFEKRFLLYRKGPV